MVQPRQRGNMSGVLDLDLQEPPEPPPDLPPPKRPLGLWIVVAALLGTMAIAAYFAFIRRTGAPTAAPTQPVAAAPQPARPLGGDADSVVVPPLAESDPVVRELVRQLSSHPRVLAWLTTNGLIRNFTVSVSNVAEGVTPKRHLAVLRPSSKFRVIERNGTVYVDPRSYDRYDGLAEAVASIDPAGAARLYATLKPRIEEANRELGGSSFDQTLERAIVLLLETPIPPEGNVHLLPEVQGIGYGFADPELENLTGAQKQLLRMGPRNAAAIQSSLRAIALALGIPDERLPRARTARPTR
jgi:hypothetical protein